MSTDLIGAAFERDDAAVAASAPQFAAEPSCKLSGIAMAIARVEALLAACGPGPESSDPIERIADIAFVLHERDVEASLCDALDVAVRELSSANAVRQANVQHVRQAAELLRELSRRIADMIAPLQVSSSPAPNDLAAGEGAPSEPHAAPAEDMASEDPLDGEIPREGLFAADLLEDDEFACAVAELAASLPALAEPVEAGVVTLREPTDLAADEPALTPKLDEGTPEAPGEPVDFAAGDTALASESKELVAVAQREPADFGADESALTSEPDEAVAVTQNEPADPAAAESALAPDSEAAIAMTQDEPANLAADEPVLAPEQQALSMGDAPAAIEQMQAEESPTAEVLNEQPSREDTSAAVDALQEDPMDEATTNATLLSESALGETLSGEALLQSADVPAPSSASLANGHAVVSPPDPNTPNAPTESLSTLTPQESPESETAPAPDGSPVAAPSAGHELLDEAVSPLADATAEVAVEQPSDQYMPHHNGAGPPAQAAAETNGHDAADAAAEPAIDVSETPPPRFTESSQSLLPELALVDPQDDPGDLFEPLAGAAAPVVETNLASEVSAPSAEMQAFPAAAPPDPLAAMRTLSAEELLALFT